MSESAQQAIGRFAPTPSGPLHFGSLVTAVASYCDVKSRNGLWLLRIEDLDTPRVVKGSADDILHTLHNFGFRWDKEVIYQSERFDEYEQIIQQLIKQEVLYVCSCTNKSLAAENLSHGPLGLIYPGTCQNKKLPFNSSRLRLKVPHNKIMTLNDRHFGTYSMDLHKQVGDILLKRIDGIYAYHLAVVIDDAFQQVNEIVRGADLLEVSCVHLYLNQILGLTDARYLHLPLAKNSKGQKLSKQTGARAVDTKKASEQLFAALTFLGQTIPSELKLSPVTELLAYATDHWDNRLIPPID